MSDGRGSSHYGAGSKTEWEARDTIAEDELGMCRWKYEATIVNAKGWWNFKIT